MKRKLSDHPIMPRLRQALFVLRLGFLAWGVWFFRIWEPAAWPGMVAGLLVVAFPLGLALAWTRYRGRRIGQV